MEYFVSTISFGILVASEVFIIVSNIMYCSLIVIICTVFTLGSVELWCISKHVSPTEYFHSYSIVKSKDLEQSLLIGYRALEKINYLEEKITEIQIELQNLKNVYCTSNES
jgi:hypothetical protein